MSERVRTRVVVGGMVQGVYFRASTQRMAAGLGIDGWVRNLPNGDVEAVFEGAPELVQQAVAWTSRGPVRADVQHFERFDEQPEGLAGFRVTS